MSAAYPVALTIAGSDSGGGAGIQADLKTFYRFGVYGTSVLSLITAQNTTGVSRVEVLSPNLMISQLSAVLADLPPLAAKTGALGNAAMVHAVAHAAREFRFPLVVDPVAVSKHGAPLLDQAGINALRDQLLPLATLVTPNLSEVEALTGTFVRTVQNMEEAAVRIAGLGPAAVLIKGGHLADSDAVDVLFRDGNFEYFRAPRISTRHTHGTGCTYSAAITAGLAIGHSLSLAIANAKHFVTLAIERNPGLGNGSGPLNHWV